ncbi:MAG: hypothetical protein AB1728_07485 [Bacteroidota bacterium]
MKQRHMCTLMLFVIGASALLAQPMRMTADERAVILKERLTLTDDQTKKVTAILKESEKKRDAIRDEFSGDRETMREKMMSLMNDTDKKIDALLTNEQKKKYEELKKERRQQMGGRRQRRD